MSETENWLNGLAQKNGARVGLTLAADPHEPDQVAENDRLGKELGLPSVVVGSDPDGYRKRADMNRTTEALKNAPKTAQWLSDLQNGAVAKDDVENLSWFERGFRTASDVGVRAPTAGALQALGGSAEGLARTNDALSRTAMRGLRAAGMDTFADFLEAPRVPWWIDPSEILRRPGQETKAAGEVVGVPAERQNLATDITGGVGQMAAQMAMVIANPSSGAAMLFGQGVDQQGERQDQMGVGGTAQTDAALLTGGSITMLTERTGLDLILNRVPPKIRNSILRQIADIAFAGGMEAAQETVEGILQNLTALAFYDPNAEVFEGLEREALAAGGSGALARGLINMLVPGKGISRDMSGMDRAGETAEALQEIDAKVAESRLKKRSPEKFEEFLGVVQDEDLFVPADKLREFFQSKDMEIDDETLRAWGVEPGDFAAQEPSGSVVAIPKSVYAAKISGTDDAAWFHENAKIDPEGMSASEAAAFNETANEVIQQEWEKAEAAVAADEVLKADEQQIYDNIYSQLRAATNLSPDVVGHQATVWSKFFNSVGRRYGEDALDLFRKYGVDIRGPQSPDARRRGALDLQLNTLRTGKGLKPKGRSLLDFVIDEGGVQDTGGDTESMDAPKGVIADPQDGEGIGLDEMARRAIEAGYFPDLMGETAGMNSAEAVDAAARLLEAITEALGGRNTYIEGEGPDASLAALDAALSELGLDVSALTNNQIIEAMQEQSDGQVYNQAGELLTDTPEFKKWAGTEEILDPIEINYESFSGDGPWVMRVFHGTTHSFDEFDASVKGTKEGQFGAVNYFTSSESDAADNYAGAGPDLTSRIEDRRERLEQEIDDLIGEIKADSVEETFADVVVDLSNRYEFDSGAVDGMFVDNDPDAGIDIPALASYIADTTLNGRNESVLEVFVRTEKPFVVGGDTSPFIEFVDFSAIEEQAIARVADDEGVAVSEVENNRDDYEDQIDEARWDIEAGTQNPLYDAIETVAARYDADTSDLLAKVSEFASEGTDHSSLEKIFRDSETIMYAEDPETGDIVGYHMIGEILEELGFDSIILKDANARFKNMNIEDGTAHVHVFDSHNTNIKSVHNRGTFDANDPRILYQSDVSSEGVADFVNSLKNDLGLRDLSMFLSGDSDLKLNMIAVAKDAQGQGVGSEAMHRIVDFADQHGLRVVLTPGQKDDGFGTTSRARLVKFYKRFDFVENKGRNKDFSISESLYREPSRAFNQGGADNRGQIQFHKVGLDKGRTVIDLFESANLSTFMHETGHYTLEVFSALASDETAPQAMKDDLAAIHKYLGHEGGEYTTPQHEKWAQSWEAYLLEGKSPSLGLADVFARMRSWLVQIYESVKSNRKLNVKLTPEIREVMDRMLATDEEIKIARDEQSLDPLFATAPPGMSEADFRTYQNAGQRSADKANQRLIDKTMAKVRREKEAWYRAEKKAVFSEVANRINKQPVYRLTELLGNKNWFGSDKEAPDFQIDRDILVEQFGEGVLADLSRANVGGKRAIYGKGGETPQFVANFFGFESAPKMIEALQNAGKRKDAIKAEVERVMLERHGDPLHDGSIEEEAMRAVHNDQQAKTVVSEIRHLASRMGRDTGPLRTAIYRQRAKLMIGRMTVAQASKPARFLQAERTAARNAEKAFAQVTRGTGDARQLLAQAFQAKEQQILNQYLYNEALKVERYVQKGREKMRSYDKKKVREKLEGDYIQHIDALLEDYDFRVRSPNQVARAESLADYVKKMEEAGRGGELNIDPRVIAEANRKHYSKLTVNELRGLFDTIENIDHMGRFKQKLIDAARKRDLEASAKILADRVKENLGTGKAGKQSGNVRNFFNLLFSTDTMLVDIDGEEFGPAYDEVKTGIDKGMSQEQDMSVVLAERLDALYSPYSHKEKMDMLKPKNIVGSNGHLWSKAEILSVALNMGNKDNIQRMLDPRVHPERRMTRSQLDALLDTLDQRDWDFAQSMWDEIDSYWAQIADVSKRRTGVVPRKVEAQPVVTKYGVYRGGYYPIAYDPLRSAAASADEQSAWDKYVSAGRAAKASIANGMTIERENSGGGRTVNFDLTVPITHMRESIRYIALSESVDNTHRLINHPTVVSAFLDAGRKNDHQILNLWLKDVGQGPVMNMDPFNTFARVVKNNFTLSKLAFNLKTTALQITGVGQSAAVIGKRNMLMGFLDYRKRPLALANEIAEKSSFMAERKSTFQKDIYDFVTDVKMSSPLANRLTKSKSLISKAGFAPIVYTQFYAIDMPTWLGAYRAGLEKGFSEDKAIHFADRMVARSQGSGLMSDRSAIERGTLNDRVRQADVVRVWTTLASYMMTKMNRGYLTSLQGGRDFKAADGVVDKTGVALNAAADLFMLYVTEAAMMAVLYANLNDDDEDADDIAEFILKEAGIATVAGIPLVSNAANAFSGYGAGGVLDSAFEIPYNLYTQGMQGEFDKAFRRSIGDTIGIATGLPTGQSMRVIEGLIDSDETPPAEALFGWNPLSK